MASPDDLRFQDFGGAGKDTKVNLDTDAEDGFTHKFEKFPHSARDDEEQLLGDGQGNKGQASFWTFRFYQQFFDVETDQVKTRILYSMFPKPGHSYLDYHVRPKPDLYGPFWVCVTLVFSIAISGNISNYLQTAGSGAKYVWKYDFHKVSYAATAVFFYVWVLPIFLYLVCAWKKSTQISFLEILCVYGYSLCIYVPISILWVIQVTWLQWLFVMVGSVLSGFVLIQSLWPSLKPAPSEDGPRSWSSWALVGVVAFLHLLLAIGFMMYFFHVPSSALAVGANPSPVDAVNPIPGSKSVQNPVPVAKAVESSRVSQVDTKRSVNERKLDVPKVNGTSQASNFTSN
jgi:hypothetical protein